jgi:hypothetical protein
MPLDLAYDLFLGKARRSLDAQDRGQNRGRRVGGDGPCTKSSISFTIASSASVSQMRWSALSSSTILELGICAAVQRAASTGSVTSRVAWSTMVGARTMGSAGRTSIRSSESRYDAAAPGLAEARWNRA